MTREEAKHMRLFTQWQEREYSITWKTTTAEIIEDHDLIIDKIYDYFDNMLCEHCYWNISDEYMTRCSLIGDITQYNFGCNKFKKG